MHSPAFGKRSVLPGHVNFSISLPPFKAIWIAVFLMFSALAGHSQTISLSARNEKMETLFRKVEEQTPFRFVFSHADLLQAKPVTLELKSGTIQEFLILCFAAQPLEYSLSEMMIIVRTKTSSQLPYSTPPASVVVKGIVLSEDGPPVAGANVEVKRTGQIVKTDTEGSFSLPDVKEKETLVVTSVGFESQEVRVAKTNLTITLKTKVTRLDETVIMAYGTTTRRLSTGNITKVSAEEIARQPVTNPLAALQGRVPGVTIQQSSGVPGSSFNIEIRGRSAIDLTLSGNDPLFIIDGVPFEPGNRVTNQVASAANKPTSVSVGGLSPLNTINPQDIESIEVLKDADAIAIYGSRGANGVVLITTKKGKAGPLKVTLNYNTGWSKVSRTMDMLNTSQYVAVRREAFKNDGSQPTLSTAPDLLAWDTTRYTDFKKLLIGKTARIFNTQVSLSGGNAQTNFLLSGGFHRETSVYSTSLYDQVISLSNSVHHTSLDKRFKLDLSSYYARDKNLTTTTDLTRYINLPPHLKVYDNAGGINWSEGGINFTSVNSIINPLSLLQKEYNSVNDNLASNLQLRYLIGKGLFIKVSAGFNRFTTEESALNPRSSIPPTSTTLPFSSFANAQSSSWILEPQTEFNTMLWKGKVSILAGATLQHRYFENTQISATNYTSDLLLNSLDAAGNLLASSSDAQYRYIAGFGRINYNLLDRYVLNLSGRRDGSSRFGPDKRFQNFGALGLAWVFSSEKFIKKSASFLSFGKLRGSYGLTGNDQIGDYRYLDLWSASNPYQGIPGFQTRSLYNPDYEWTRSRKLELAVELGFFKDRLQLTAAWYRSRSSNQLLNYQLPSQTGFATIVKNLPATVENRGLELSFFTKTLSSNQWTWTTSFNLTIPRNKLVSFPELASSSYSDFFEVGGPLSIYKGYRYLGVDPDKGVYSFEDINKDGQITLAGDRVFLGDTDPDYYGGLSNTLTFKGLSLDIFFEFRKQTGLNYLSKLLTSNFPGTITNQPVAVLERWQKAGDVTSVERFSRQAGGPAGLAARNLAQSGGVYTDASYARLKNLALAYDLSSKWLHKAKIQKLRLYVNGQNLFVLTRYKGSDPEIQDIYVLPPLKTVVVGIQASF